MSFSSINRNKASFSGRKSGSFSELNEKLLKNESLSELFSESKCDKVEDLTSQNKKNVLVELEKRETEKGALEDSQKLLTSSISLLENQVTTFKSDYQKLKLELISLKKKSIGKRGDLKTALEEQKKLFSSQIRVC